MSIRKLPADDRIGEIVDAVEAAIVRDRTLAFGMNEVATEIGASRALIYVYFDSVPQIIDKVAQRLLIALERMLRDAGGAEDAGSFARELGRRYLAYLIEHGPALQYILRDSERNGRLAKAKPLFKGLMRSLAKDACAQLRVEPREALVLVELLSAIPDSLARQIRDGQIDAATAFSTCDRLMTDLVADLAVVR